MVGDASLTAPEELPQHFKKIIELHIGFPDTLVLWVWRERFGLLDPVYSEIVNQNFLLPSAVAPGIGCILPLLLGRMDRLYGCLSFKPVIRTACINQLVASSSRLTLSENLIILCWYLAFWSEFFVLILS